MSSTALTFLSHVHIYISNIHPKIEKIRSKLGVPRSKFHTPCNVQLIVDCLATKWNALIVIQWQTLRKVVIYANESKKSYCLDRWIFSWKKFGRGNQTADKSTCNISRYLFFWRDDTNLSARDIFKVILTELECIWSKAAIPMKDRKQQLYQLIPLYNQWKSLKKISLSRRQKQSKLIETKIHSFKKVLASLCDLSATDAYHQLRSSRRKHWKEDWNFYENQKTSRTFNI